MNARQCWCVSQRAASEAAVPMTYSPSWGNQVMSCDQITPRGTCITFTLHTCLKCSCSSHIVDVSC